jgi:hypothetical protein
MYTKPVGEICRNELNNHFFADDSELYLFFKPVTSISIRENIKRIERCLDDIVSWMNVNMLKLKGDKTKFIIFSSEQNAQHVSDVAVTVNGSKISQSSSVCNLVHFLTRT